MGLALSDTLSHPHWVAVTGKLGADIMRQVDSSVKAARTEIIEGKVVKKQVLTTRDKRNGGRFFLSDIVIDFSDCTESEILTLATRSLVIEWQNKVRSAKTDADAQKIAETITVRKYLDEKRKILTTEQRKERALAEMKKHFTKDEILAMLADEESED